MTDAFENWYVRCNDCSLESGPWQYRATAVSERDLHELATEHRATVFLRLPQGAPSHLARNQDPETSHEAAKYMVETGKLGKDQRTALECICAHPGMVAGEFWDFLHISGLWKRPNELRKLGLIVYGEKRVYKGTGRNQVTLWPADSVQRQMPL